MTKGTLTVVGGLVVGVTPEVEGYGTAQVIPNEPLDVCLAKIGKEGWRVDHEVFRSSPTGDRKSVGIIKYPFISIVLRPQGAMEKYAVDMEPSDIDLVNRQPLNGRFVDFRKTEGKWQQLAAAAEQGTTTVNVEGRGYKLTSGDADGNFKLEPA